MATKLPTVNNGYTYTYDPTSPTVAKVGNQTQTRVDLPVTKPTGTGGAPAATTTAQQKATGTGTGISFAGQKSVLEALKEYQQAKADATAAANATATRTGYYTAVTDPRAADYANYVAEAYARTQPGNAPAWEDKWQPQIDALQGGRYGPYESPYQARIDGLLDRILNREEFRYNWSDDPLYRQYAARYQQQARQGMQDAMGAAAGLTGGYGSTYAQAAGQQAYAQQMQGLNDAAMQLYQLAKDRYDTRTRDLHDNMSMLEQREAVNRGMYQDDRDTWYSRQDADIANLRNSQLMGWNAYQDAADREMAEREMAWNQYQYWNGLYEQLRTPSYVWHDTTPEPDPRQDPVEPIEPIRDDQTKEPKRPGITAAYEEKKNKRKTTATSTGNSSGNTSRSRGGGSKTTNMLN